MDIKDLELISKKIIEKGYKKKFVAEKTNISSVQLSQYLNGKRVMPTEVYTKIINFLSL